MALVPSSDADALLELAAGMESEAASVLVRVWLCLLRTGADCDGLQVSFSIVADVKTVCKKRGVADEESDMVRKKHNAYFNYPVCTVLDHRVHTNAGVERQRHSCTKCLLDDWRILKTNPFIVPWQMALVIGTLTRQYVCMLCVLEKADLPELAGAFPKQTKCKRHWVFNRQSRCTRHDRQWYLCFDCAHDPRAGKRYCLLCGRPLGSLCGCPRTPGAIRDVVVTRAKRLPEEQSKLMGELTVAILKYAELLQATSQIDAADEREARVEEIKSTFPFPDAGALDRTFKSAGC